MCRGMARAELSSDDSEYGSEYDGLIVPVTLSDATDHVSMTDEALPGGVYGMAIAVFIRDSRRVALAASAELPTPAIRVMRFCLSLFVVYTLLAIQFWLAIETKRLVSPMSVHEIREVYSRFEEVMYTDSQGVSHTWLNSLGNSRGEAEWFDASNFDRLSLVEKEDICMIPLTMPSFTIVILCIWAITCMGEVRKVLGLAGMVWRIPTVDTMADSLSFDGVDVDAGEARVEGLTCLIRSLILGTLLLPRFLLTVLLMWLGCRWLLATLGFSDLLLNSIALEFILLLQEMIYVALVPQHTMKETEGTFLPARTKSYANYNGYFNTFVFAVLAVLYVLSYFYVWQTVLVDYQWDVATVCESYLAELLAV